MENILPLFNDKEIAQMKQEDYSDILWLKNWIKQFRNRRLARILDRTGIYEITGQILIDLELYTQEMIKQWEKDYDQKITEYKRS